MRLKHFPETPLFGCGLSLEPVVREVSCPTRGALATSRIFKDFFFSYYWQRVVRVWPLSRVGSFRPCQTAHSPGVVNHRVDRFGKKLELSDTTIASAPTRSCEVLNAALRRRPATVVNCWPEKTFAGTIGTGDANGTRALRRWARKCGVGRVPSSPDN